MIRLHKILVLIISDRDVRLTSKFWRSLQEALCIKLNFSTIFHPHMDTQTYSIQILEDTLWVCVIDIGGDWDDMLLIMEFSYNNSYHASIRMTLYEALYGRPCKSPIYWDKIGER